MIPVLNNNLIPEILDVPLAQIPTTIIGFIRSDGQREYRPYETLEELYHDLLFLDTPINYFPDYLIMSDGSILVYVHQMFYQAFSLKAFTEAELRELIDLSNLMKS